MIIEVSATEKLVRFHETMTFTNETLWQKGKSLNQIGIVTSGLLLDTCVGVRLKIKTLRNSYGKT